MSLSPSATWREVISSKINGVTFVGHNGGTPGYEGQIDIYPQLGYVVVILSNQDHVLRPVFKQEWRCEHSLWRLDVCKHLGDLCPNWHGQTTRPLSEGKGSQRCRRRVTLGHRPGARSARACVGC